jgi:hypothetical protein
MENSHELFDDEIRAKLENLRVPGAPEGWDIFQAKLDAAAMAADVNPFDEMIKSKLEGTKAAYDPGFWSLMESKIEAEADLTPSDVEDVEFDGLIYENLNYFNVPYNPNHWDIMLLRIKQEFSIQHQLYKYKVAEIALMALIIFTVMQYFPVHGKLKFNKVETAQTVIEDTDKVPATTIAVQPQADIISNNNTTNQTAANQLETSAKKGSRKSTDSVFSNNKNITVVEQTSASAVLLAAKGILPTLVKKEYGGTSISDSALAAQEAAEKAVEETRTKEGQMAALLFDPFDLPVVQQAGFGLLTLESRQTEQFPQDMEMPISDCAWCKVPKRWAFKLGMLTSMDLNLVMTPYDAYFRASSYDRLSTGYTGGISFSVQRNRVGFATGLAYSSKAYEVKQNKEVVGNLLEGYTAQGLEAAQLNILTVPANLTYTFDNKGSWQWYTLVGTSAKIATINNYDYRFAPVSASKSPLPPTVPTPPGHESEETEEPAEPYAGAFEGGDFKRNLFLTANLGFGMERYVTNRWSVFFQPTYEHSLYKRGLGPNNDRIHTMSFLLGTRTTLK